MKRTTKRLLVDLSLTAQTEAGSAVYAWEICHRLMRQAMPMQVMPLTSPFRVQGRTGIRRKLNGLLRDLLWRPLLAGLEARPDDCFLFTNAFVPRKFWRRKFGVVILDLGAWHDRALLSWRGRLGTRSLPAVLAGATHIFAISEHTAQDVAREFAIPLHRITLAPCGLSEAFSAPAAPLATINGIPLPPRYLLHVGSLEPKKNIPFLLQVFAQLRQQDDNPASPPTGTRPPCKLVLTGGESWHDASLRQAVADHPYAEDILILGRVAPEELPALYHQAAALVFPSLLEGFGLPVIEALSQGTPALVQANSSLTQFGAYGATVLDSFEPELWVRRLQEILASEAGIPEKQRQAIQETFNWDRTAAIIHRAMLGAT
ncbi:glycosyltransferase family 4 protein [Desulfonatronum lacustre]|uniref:glycosyltransferase family 4 protein n=1 Tax=Desulfonatronum lacustre TaxID=66849 RepID=UPI000491CB66|nr:glycosyltransferase family 1 protein [Desulfonatronum lacustre]SMP72771.1 Glycosyl transferases group 1 [Desulfonatronum zhilinae]